MTLHDLAVIIPSTNEGSWLEACLPTLFARAGELALDVLIADNRSTDETAAVVARHQGARRVVCDNHGFAHANNRALMEADARYVLFLNPDTELVDGTLADLVARMDAAPEIGLAGCRQVDGEGRLQPTMRRFPSPLRQLGEALASERWPLRPAWAGERELRMARYEQEFDLDWTSGSFMLVRREALEAAGWMDERFFIYSEEVDLALRIRRAGWSVRHLPQMTIVHHAGKIGWKPAAAAQYAYSRRLYARKHFGRAARAAFLSAAAVRAGLRLALFGLSGRRDARTAQLAALRVLAGRDGPPYEAAPPVAVRKR